MNEEVRLPRPVYVRTGDHPIYSAQTIEVYLPLAAIIKSNKSLWPRIESINLDFRKFPFVEGADMSELYPDYERTRLEAEALIAEISEAIGAEGIWLDRLSRAELWAFIHNYYFRPIS